MGKASRVALSVLWSLAMAFPALAAPPAPAVAILSPMDGACVHGSSLQVVVSFQAQGNVKDIDLLVNGQILQTFTNPPNVKSSTHTFELGLANYPEGPIQIQAQGFQGNRNAGLVGLSPVVALTLDRTAPV